MGAIVFTFDPALTGKNRCFTVVLTAVEKRGAGWQKTPGTRIYRASDLPRLTALMPDKTLFRTALESEMALRKTEGRFLSADQEFTRLRIANRFLPAFVAACARKRLLIDQDGRPLVFDTATGVRPELALVNGRLTVFIEGTALADAETVLTAPPVTLVRERRLIQLPPALTWKTLSDLPRGKAMDDAQWEALVTDRTRQEDTFGIRGKGRTPARAIRNVRPRAVLNMAEDVKKAELFFDYRGVMVRDNDPKDPVYDPDGDDLMYRDPAREDEIRAKLLALGFFMRNDEDANWFLARNTLDGVWAELAQQGIRVRLAGGALTRTLSVHWSLSADRNRLLVGGRVIEGDLSMGLDPLLSAVRDNRAWFKRPDGSCGLLGADLRKTLADLVENGRVSGGRISFTRPDIARVSALLGRDADITEAPEVEPLRRFAASPTDIRAYDAPPSLSGILRAYQLAGYRWLRTLRELGLCGILADDMGLGKTLQVLTLILALKQEGRLGGPVLLIAPKTLLFNWELELKKFAPELSVLVFAGPSRPRDPRVLTGHDLVLTSYGLLRTDTPLLASIVWDSLILDEAQAIKNPHAQVSKAVKQIPCPVRLTLTGTPVENAATDLWSQFDFLMPGFLGGLRAFKDTYGSDTARLAELRKRTRPYILRRLKSQVLSELPPKTDTTLFCDFTDSQRAVYDQALMAARQELEDISEKTSFTMLRLLLRLRLIACHPALCVKKSPTALTSGKQEAVFHAAMEILSEGHKILIFSQFTRHLKLAQAPFQRLSVPSFYLDGKTADRARVVRDFQDYPGPCLFFISLKTGGTGLNLSEADYVFLLDPWWNPAVENQAIDRCHRLGQKNAVTVYRFITRGSIEEKVNELKGIKKDIEEALIRDSAPDRSIPDEAALKSLLLSDMDQ